MLSQGDHADCSILTHIVFRNWGRALGGLAVLQLGRWIAMTMVYGLFLPVSKRPLKQNTPCRGMQKAMHGLIAAHRRIMDGAL